MTEAPTILQDHPGFHHESLRHLSNSTWIMINRTILFLLPSFWGGLANSLVATIFRIQHNSTHFDIDILSQKIWTRFLYRHFINSINSMFVFRFCPLNFQGLINGSEDFFSQNSMKDANQRV